MRQLVIMFAVVLISGCGADCMLTVDGEVEDCGTYYNGCPASYEEVDQCPVG